MESFSAYVAFLFFSLEVNKEAFKTPVHKRGCLAGPALASGEKRKIYACPYEGKSLPKTPTHRGQLIHVCQFRNFKKTRNDLLPQSILLKTSWAQLLAKKREAFAGHQPACTQQNPTVSTVIKKPTQARGCLIGRAQIWLHCIHWNEQLPPIGRSEFDMRDIWHRYFDIKSRNSGRSCKQV